MENDSLDSRNKELNKKIGDSDLPNAVDTLIKDASRRKRQVRWLTISLCIELLLTFGLATVAVQNRKLAVRAETNHASIVRNCETANEARANNKLLWEYLFAIEPAEPPTPAQQKQIDDFKAFVNKTFAPRDCNSIQ